MKQDRRMPDISTGTKLLIFQMLFFSGITASVLLSAKITSIGPFTLTAGAFAYVLTFPCTDIISECFGEKDARRTVTVGAGAYAVTAFLAWLAVSTPPADFWASSQSGYAATLSQVPRIVAAAIVTFFVAQHHDVWAFEFWRRLTRGRHLWLRNNASTLVSQLIDSVMFVTLAFWGVVPADVLVNMIIGQYIVKAMIAVLDTPLVYLGVMWIGTSAPTDGEGGSNGR